MRLAAAFGLDLYVDQSPPNRKKPPQYQCQETPRPAGHWIRHRFLRPYKWQHPEVRHG
jgi:hypothetical protein